MITSILLPDVSTLSTMLDPPNDLEHQMALDLSQQQGPAGISSSSKQ